MRKAEHDKCALEAMLRFTQVGHPIQLGGPFEQLNMLFSWLTNLRTYELTNLRTHEPTNLRTY